MKANANQSVSAKTTVSFNQKELFEQYVIPYSNMVYWICIKYSDVHYYIEDNYQEALVILYKYIHTYNPERGPVKVWLYIVASRAVRTLNAGRRQSLVYKYDLSRVADDFYYYDVESSRKADYLTNYRLLFSDDILWALDQLKPVYRETLLLFLSGYTMREIVDISYSTGNLESKNIETVKSRLHLARKQMRRMIDENGNRRRV